MSSSKETNGLNIILVIILYLIILRHVINAVMVVSSYFSMRGSLFAYDGTYVLYSLLICAIVISSLIGVLKLKKWGVYLFYASQLVNAVCITSIAGDGPLHFMVSIILSGVFSLLLLLRSNGKSAWKLIFSK